VDLGPVAEARDSGAMGRTRLIEALAYISTELDKGFKPFFSPKPMGAERANARQAIIGRLELLAANFGGPRLLGPSLHRRRCASVRHYEVGSDVRDLNTGPAWCLFRADAGERLRAADR
jgi:hypothetical protein